MAALKLVYAVGIEPTMFLMSRVTVCRHTTNSSLTYIVNKQKVDLINIDQFFIYFLHLVTALLFQVQAVLPRSL